MDWERIPDTAAAGLVNYGAKLDDATLVVGFDPQWPEYGWSASYKIGRGKTVFIDPPSEAGFKSKKAAQIAVIAAIKNAVN